MTADESIQTKPTFSEEELFCCMENGRTRPNEQSCGHVLLGILGAVPGHKNHHQLHGSRDTETSPPPRPKLLVLLPRRFLFFVAPQPVGRINKLYGKQWPIRGPVLNFYLLYWFLKMQVCPTCPYGTVTTTGLTPYTLSPGLILR